MKRRFLSLAAAMIAAAWALPALAEAIDPEPLKPVEPQGALPRAQLGDKKEAVDLLQKYLTDHPEHRRGFQKVNAWWWRDLQNDSRFKSLIAAGG